MIPSFGSFAGTPNLASAYTAGAHVELARQKLQQDAIQAEQEMLAKQEVFKQQQLRQQQEMEIDKAYKQAQIGLHQRQLDEAQKRIQLSTEAAAQKMLVQQNYQKRFAELTASGTAPDEASRQAMMEIGPSMFGGAGAAAVKPRLSLTDFGPATPLPGATGKLQAMTGAGSRRIFDAPKEAIAPKVVPIEGAPNLGMVGNKVVNLGDPTKELRAELKALQKTQDADTPGKLAAGAEADRKHLGPADKLYLQTYKDRQARIDKLKADIEAARSRTSTPPNQISLPSGITGGTTNRVGRFRVIGP